MSRQSPQSLDTSYLVRLTEPADEGELQQLRSLLVTDLDEGALGIGLALDYFSDGIQAPEMQMIFSLAAERDVPVFVHVRRGIDGA